MTVKGLHIDLRQSLDSTLRTTLIKCEINDKKSRRLES